MRILFFFILISSINCRAQDTLRQTLIGKWGIDIPADQIQKQLLKVSALNVAILDLDDSIKMFKDDSVKVQQFREEQETDKLIISETAAHFEKLHKVFLQFNLDSTLLSNNGNEGTFTVDEKNKLLFVKRKTDDTIDTVQVEEYNHYRIVLQLINEKEKIILIPFDDGLTPPDEEEEQKN